MGPILVGKKLTDPQQVKPIKINYQEIPVRTDHRTTVIARGIGDISRVCKKYNVNETTRKELSDKYNVKL